jgi:hypothetical protein
MITLLSSLQTPVLLEVVHDFLAMVEAKSLSDMDSQDHFVSERSPFQKNGSEILRKI